MAYRNFLIVIGALVFLSLVSLTHAADEAAFQWHPGASAAEMSQAKVIRIGSGFRSTDLAAMHGDQMIETPSGKRISVARLRAIQQMFAHARERNASARPNRLRILPPPSGPCSQLRPGETLDEVLARSSGDVICFHSGRRATVEQIRLLQALAGSRFATAHRADVSGASSSAPAVGISNAQEMFAQLQHAPDSTVLVNPKGVRITVGALRASIVAAHGRSLYRTPTPAGR